MINSEPSRNRIDAAVESASCEPAPAGAILVAGLAVAVVIGLWFAFYLMVFVPRGFAVTDPRRHGCRGTGGTALGQRVALHWCCLLVVMAGLRRRSTKRLCRRLNWRRSDPRTLHHRRGVRRSQSRQRAGTGRQRSRCARSASNTPSRPQCITVPTPTRPSRCASLAPTSSTVS